MNVRFEISTAAIERACEQDDDYAAEKAVLELDLACLEEGHVPDEVVTRVLAACSSTALLDSRIPAHALNLFEFQADRLSASQRGEVLAFLKRHANMFSHVHTQQVVSELLSGRYLW